jgi:hypothetical protein
MAKVTPIYSIPGDIFTWHKGVGVVEDSTLLANNYHYFTSHAVVKSHKTGEYKSFYFVSEVTNEDEDVMAWIYESEDGFQIHILND